MAQQPLTELKGIVEEEIAGVDFTTLNGGVLTFTIMWGGVGEDGYESSYGDIEAFTREYNVGVSVVSGDASHTTYKIEQNGEPFEWDVKEDILVC